LEVNGNIINNGTIDGESSSKIYFGGNNLTNGSSALIDPYEFYFTKSGEQTAVGLNKFHATVHTKINSGSITSFGDSETLSLDYGSLTILSGGRLNISGTVTITGEGNIYDYGTLYVNSLSTLLINGDNGENTSTALTLNVYTNQITGSDGSLRFTGYCQILAQNNGSITGGSLNLILESGTLYLGPNTGSETEIIINGGFANYGGTFTTSPSIIIFNSDIVNAGTSNISRVDFRGSTITNTGNLNILYFLHFNSGGTQTVNGLTNLNIAVEGKVKGTTKLILDNQYSTPEEQVLTLGNSCTFTIEENAEIEIDGSVTITGSTGCSSVPNDNCGNLIKYGKITINSGKRLDITCGEIQIHNTSFLGSGTLGLGQETTSSDLNDNTFINLNVAYIESPSLTVEILEGGCVEIVSGFNFVGPVHVKG
ncbi:MAG: hypothetical protein Q8T08_04950, partial [Ignavibacteria bacterium]|nr:hypothetical protein [Ignavibacteria bacterium]